jgi:hypothetical protein
VSKLSQKIAPDPKVVARRRSGAPGPRNKCWPLYGAGDLEDWEAVDALRETLDWREVQTQVDGLLGITTPIPKDRFRRHWMRGCDCWPQELKR